MACSEYPRYEPGLLDFSSGLCMPAEVIVEPIACFIPTLTLTSRPYQFTPDSRKSSYTSSLMLAFALGLMLGI